LAAVITLVGLNGAEDLAPLLLDAMRNVIIKDEPMH